MVVPRRLLTVSSMRIFVAGGSGVVGRRLVPLLVASGHEVVALSRGREVVGASSTVVGDVYDAAALRALVAAGRPDVVMHQLTDLSSRDFAANIRIRHQGTRNLVDAALAAGARRVVSQSIAWAYAPAAGVVGSPADESVPLDTEAADEGRRASVGAVAALERMTAEAPEWVNLRYGMLYGPGTWYAKDGLMASAPLPFSSDVTSFLHVEDAARAAVAALDWPSGAVNVVDDEPAPATTWAPIFAEAVGAPAPDEPTPTTPWARGATNQHARALGWTPTRATWRRGFFE
jgi:nucleoside-diphosphate-sugar epimerase